MVLGLTSTISHSPVRSCCRGRNKGRERNYLPSSDSESKVELELQCGFARPPHLCSSYSQRVSQVPNSEVSPLRAPMHRLHSSPRGQYFPLSLFRNCLMHTHSLQWTRCRHQVPVAIFYKDLLCFADSHIAHTWLFTHLTILCCMMVL